MSFRGKVILLGSLCAALLVTFLLGQVFSPERKAGGGAALFPGLKTEAVRKVSVKAGSAEILLVREKDWLLQESGRSFPASAKRVDSMLKEISTLKRGNVITSRQDAWAGLGLQGADAKILTLYGGKGEKLAELTIGKTGVGGGGSYIRLGDEKQVYQTGSSLASSMETERRFWSDLRLLPDGLKPENVTRISFRGRMAFEEGKKARSLDYSLLKAADAKGKMHWTFEGQKDEAIDEAKVEQILSNMIGAEGNDFADASENTRKAMAEAKAEVTFSLGDNREYTLVVGSKAEGSQYYASLKGGELAYLVPEWRLERILVERDSLKSPTR